MINQYCYGNDYGKHPECRTCKEKKWCKEAQGPTMLSGSMCHYNEGLGANPPGSLCHPADFSEQPNENAKSVIANRTYTYEEVCNLVETLFKLNYETFELLADKLNFPVEPMLQLARRRRITRQTVYQRIKVACEKIPELKQVFGVKKRASCKDNTAQNPA